MDPAITKTEDRVEVREDGARVITPGFAKDAPAPVEKRESNPFVDGPKQQQDEMQKILARIQKTAEENKHKIQEKKAAETAGKELPKYDAAIQQNIEEKKKLIREKQALNLREKEYQDRLKKLEEYEKAKENPLKFLEAGGHKYEDLVNFMVNNPDSLSEKDKKLLSLEQEVQSLKKMHEEKARIEQEQAARQQFDNFFTQVKNSVDADDKKEDYELIRVTESYQPLIDRMANVWRETGEIPDVHDVAKDYETEVLNFALETIKKSPKLQSKIKAVLNLGKEPAPVTPIKEAEKTLSNASVVPTTTEIPVRTVIHGGRNSNVAALQEVEERLRQKGLWPFAT